MVLESGDDMGRTEKAKFERRRIRVAASLPNN